MENESTIQCIDRSSSDPIPTPSSIKDSSSRTLQEEEPLAEVPSKVKRRRGRGVCSVSASTSHTQYFRRDSIDKEIIKKITTDEFCGISESISGPSDSFRCVHNIEPKKYTKKGLLKRNILKNLDPLPKIVDSKQTEECGLLMGWDVTKKLVFLMKDPIGSKQVDRLQEHLRDLAKTSSNGFRINVLDDLSVILDFLVDSLVKEEPYYRDGFMELMKNAEKPISLIVASDVVTYFDSLRNFIGHLGCLLLPLDGDDLFQLVSKALLYQLSASDKQRGQGTVHLRHTLIAARKVLYQIAARMIAVAKPARFPTFLQIAVLLACDCEDNCVDLMMENIFENIFYRFNPYFPVRELPVYDINPSSPDDFDVQLGESSKNLQQMITLMLVLVRTIQKFLEEHPEYHRIFPRPDDYSQRCFVWAFRYECRVRDHRQERSSLTIIAHVLINIFEGKLVVLGNMLMADVLTLSVLTEIPQSKGWISTVNFNTSYADVHFKILLMHLSVDFLKLYPCNQFMAEHFIIGLMYLVDPDLSKLKVKWTSALYTDVQRGALQSLVCALKLVAPETKATRVSLIRRVIWYLDWYFYYRYDLSVLYWSVRLLQTALLETSSPLRAPAVGELLNSHSIFGVMHLVIGILTEKEPPLEKNQAIVSLCLRLMTSCLQESKGSLTLFEYPTIKWPKELNRFVRKMLDLVVYNLQRRFIVADRWLLSMMNLIWEAIIWKPENRKSFIANGGIYQLLDLITMARYPVQCMILAIICDIMRDGGAIGPLITWRASAMTIGAAGSAMMRANTEHPTVLVPHGATIAALLVACFKRDCSYQNIKLDENGIIQDLDFPLMSQRNKKYMSSQEYMENRNQRTPFSLAAFSLAGSRMSKCYAILQMLSEDLTKKVELADEAYNLYKNVKLKGEDETILVLISHYLTIKLNEVWLATQLQSHGFIPQDTEITNEFLEIGRGWAKSIQAQQKLVRDKFIKMEEAEENNLYSFLERARLNTALDALREVKCIARSTDRARITHALIFDAVRAYHCRSVIAKKIMAPVVQTYPPPLDDFNMIGQNIKIINILPKHMHKKRDDYIFDESPHVYNISKTESEEDAADQGAQGERESLISNDSSSYRSGVSGEGGGE